ncbi:DUF695 domain-containing protein [Pseudoxanthomonas japonensis]|uniref:DUF695 domain-containing protein n=1 Tax=Pseudoxanthomonas japonensis TaxID=69284 RepID=A0ABQ6ZCB0_9GAMM|nr:DUF695 domain-containing protein [Pseudoxanthomonas japonensis]KAF1720105.1 hypothetical protein CSC78_18665 [Pseudoxanthomonas japonensis]
MAGIYKDDLWSVGEGNVDGSPILVRARSALPAAPDRAIYENLIIITWPYDSDESGMPAADVYEQMRRFEDLLETAVGTKGVGVQAASLTGNGSKEWRYYTHDPDDFMSKLNLGFAGHTRYPVDLQMFLDSEWDALAQLLSERA